MTKFPFGTDYKLLIDEDGSLDVDTTFAEETDQSKILMWDILKTITTAQGVLWWAPTETEDLNESLNDTLTPAQITELQGRLKGALESDPRFNAVSVLGSKIGRDLSIKIEVVASEQNITLTLVRKSDRTLSIEESNGTI